MNLPEPAPAARNRARLGTTLKGKYKLEGLLGAGGMAAVYSATHRNAKRVAVKILHAELSLFEDLRTRFLREGYVANSVDHPGAVEVLDDDVDDDGAAFLVMELLEGEALDRVHRRLGPSMPPPVVLAVAEGVLDVLVAAHARSIIHRDIKPANLFLTLEGQLKVLDFGVARMSDAPNGEATHSGLALGTPSFMAPEQAMGRTSEIDGRTDLWALGATMFALLTGRQVHSASSRQEAMIWAATKPAPSLATLRPDLSPTIVRLVDRALAFSREDRWESAAVMRDATRAAFAETGAELVSREILSAVAPGALEPNRGAEGDAFHSGMHSMPTVDKSDARSLAAVSKPVSAALRRRVRVLAVVVTLALCIGGTLALGAWLGSARVSPPASGTPVLAAAPSASPASVPAPSSPSASSSAAVAVSAEASPAAATASAVVAAPLPARRARPTSPSAAPSASPAASASATPHDAFYRQ